MLNEVNLSAISPALSRFILPVRAIGNPGLVQESMTAYEVGYVGQVGSRATVTASVYWNTTDDGIFFTQIASYSPSNPPPTWPPSIPTFVIGLIPPPGLPAVFSYRNLGTVKDKGLELGVDAVVNRAVNVFVNYSFQADPGISGFDPSEANMPANNRFNAGINFGHDRYLGNLSVNYAGEAYWQDVLDAALRRHDRCLHAGQRRLRRALVRRPRHHQRQGHQCGQQRGAAAHLRRHPAAAGGRRSQVHVLRDQWASRGAGRRRRHPRARAGQPKAC